MLRHLSVGCTKGVGIIRSVCLSMRTFMLVPVTHLNSFLKPEDEVEIYRSLAS